MADNFCGRSSSSRLRISQVARQRLNKSLIKRRSVRREEHWALFAREIIWQDEAMEMIGDDEVTSRTRKIPRKQQMSIGDCDCVYVIDF